MKAFGHRRATRMDETDALVELDIPTLCRGRGMSLWKSGQFRLTPSIPSCGRWIRRAMSRGFWDMTRSELLLRRVVRSGVSGPGIAFSMRVLPTGRERCAVSGCR